MTNEQVTSSPSLRLQGSLRTCTTCIASLSNGHLSLSSSHALSGNSHAAAIIMRPYRVLIAFSARLHARHTTMLSRLHFLTPSPIQVHSTQDASLPSSFPCNRQLPSFFSMRQLPFPFPHTRLHTYQPLTCFGHALPYMTVLLSFFFRVRMLLGGHIQPSSWL